MRCYSTSINACHHIANMRFLMHLFAVILVAVAACGQLTQSKSTASLGVKLNPIGNTAMQVVLTNTGGVDLNLLHKGTILGDAPNQKVIMYSNNDPVPFRGISFRLVQRGDLGADSFTQVPVGQSVTAEFDAAEQYNLSTGGTFTAIAVGYIPYTQGNSTVLDGKAIPYRSNVIEVNVDGSEAAKIRTASSRLVMALEIRDSCEGDFLEKLTTATTGDGGCRDQADAGYEDAKSEKTTDLYKKVFQKDDKTYKKVIRGRLNEIADECDVVEPGPIKFYCEDVWGFCYDLGVEWSAAYTDDGLNQICLCERAYTLPAFTDKCHDVDLAGLLVHELSHLSSIYEPPARDYAIGWEISTDHDLMDATHARDNADSYRLYAQAAFLGCPLDD
ncbi:hypothetical protein SLS57_001937 [Botryosphaeria dothidea]